MSQETFSKSRRLTSQEAISNLSLMLASRHGKGMDVVILRVTEEPILERRFGLAESVVEFSACCAEMNCPIVRSRLFWGHSLPT